MFFAYTYYIPLTPPRADDAVKQSARKYTPDKLEEEEKKRIFYEPQVYLALP